MKRRLLLVMSFGLLAACDEMVGPGPGVPGSNTPPTVELTADKTEGAAPLAVSFTATASDPDGDTLEYTLVPHHSRFHGYCKECPDPSSILSD